MRDRNGEKRRAEIIIIPETNMPIRKKETFRLQISTMCRNLIRVNDLKVGAPTITEHYISTLLQQYRQLARAHHV